MLPSWADHAHYIAVGRLFVWSSVMSFDSPHTQTLRFSSSIFQISLQQTLLPLALLLGQNVCWRPPLTFNHLQIATKSAP